MRGRQPAAGGARPHPRAARRAGQRARDRLRRRRGRRRRGGRVGRAHRRRRAGRRGWATSPRCWPPRRSPPAARSRSSTSSSAPSAPALPHHARRSLARWRRSRPSAPWPPPSEPATGDVVAQRRQPAGDRAGAASGTAAPAAHGRPRCRARLARAPRHRQPRQRRAAGHAATLDPAMGPGPGGGADPVDPMRQRRANRRHRGPTAPGARPPPTDRSATHRRAELPSPTHLGGTTGPRRATPPPRAAPAGRAPARPGHRLPSAPHGSGSATGTGAGTGTSTTGVAEIERHLEKLDHEDVVLRRGRRSGLYTIVAVHSTLRGPSLGGCRMWEYEDSREPHCATRCGSRAR